jgi:hypothetical protein
LINAIGSNRKKLLSIIAFVAKIRISPSTLAKTRSGKCRCEEGDFLSFRISSHIIVDMSGLKRSAGARKRFHPAGIAHHQQGSNGGLHRMPHARSFRRLGGSLLCRKIDHFMAVLRGYIEPRSASLYFGFSPISNL